MKTIGFALLALALAGCAAISPSLSEMPALPHLAAPAPGVFTSGRLTDVDVASIQHSGIREVIDLSLDSETPDFDEAAAARSRGLLYRNLPIQGAGGLSLENVKEFDALLRSAKRPVLVHCASSNRVGAIAALKAAWLDGASTEQAIAIGKSWGLKGLEAEVRTRIEAGSVERP
jgi:uncharacterized protein (TIGR01244 family)